MIGVRVIAWSAGCSPHGDDQAFIGQQLNRSAERTTLSRRISRQQAVTGRIAVPATRIAGDIEQNEDSFRVQAAPIRQSVIARADRLVGASHQARRRMP